MLNFVEKLSRWIRFGDFFFYWRQLFGDRGRFFKIFICTLETNKNYCLFSPVLLHHVNAAALIISVARLERGRTEFFNFNLQFENYVIAFAKYRYDACLPQFEMFGLRIKSSRFFTSKLNCLISFTLDMLSVFYREVLSSRVWMKRDWPRWLNTWTSITVSYRPWDPDFKQ